MDDEFVKITGTLKRKALAYVKIRNPTGISEFWLATKRSRSKYSIQMGNFKQKEIVRKTE